ncbi:MAG: extracellular solute-binding protein [Proteobacteria bacterium]|nr:extracellular solute-binding protein [Pseudomonadota bacterium]
MKTRTIASILFPLLALLPATLMAGSLDGVEGKHAIAMHGSLKYPADFTHFDYVNPDAPKGGRFALHNIGTFDTFNGFIVKGNPAAGTGLIYNSLATKSADEALSQYGELAEEIYMPQDRSWVAFKLRGNARWHDGKPVTVEDVIWTFNKLVTDGTPFYRFYYGNVAEVLKVGNDIVRFNFQPGDNQELPLIIGQLIVLPKHYWESRDFNKTTLEPPLGSGPYRVKDFEAGRSLTLERVEDYWGADLPVHKGQFNFNEIQFDYYRDSDIALEAFKAGEYDYRPESSSKDWATSYDIPAVKSGDLIKQRFDHNRPVGMQGFLYNVRRDVFKDRRVREALAYAFDFEWSNENLFYGQYARTRSYFDNSELAATGLPGPAELEFLNPLRGRIPEEVFTKEYQPPAGGGPRAMRASLRTAGQLLDEAGWVIRDGKRVHAGSGKPLTFEVMLVSPSFERVVLPFARNLERLGIEINVRTVDTSQYRQRMDTYDFDMMIYTISQSDSPGNEQRDFWGSEAATINGGRNFIGIQDDAVDTLIEQVIEARDRQELIAVTRALDRVLQWGHWVIPQWHIKYDRVAYWNKLGQPDVTPDQGVQVMAWWVDPARAGRLKAKLKSEESVGAQ